LEYQIDTGSGYSAWKHLTISRLRFAGGTIGTNTITIFAVASGRQPTIGDYVSSAAGTHIPGGTTITGIAGTVLTLSNTFLVTVPSSTYIYFSRDIVDEPAFDPATGVKLKVRATTHTADSANTIGFIRIGTTTDSVSQQIQYPLPRTQYTVEQIQPGTDVVIYDATMTADGSGTNVLATGDAVSGSYVFDYDGTPQIKVGLFKQGWVPYVSPVIQLTSTDASFIAQQFPDRNYV